MDFYPTITIARTRAIDLLEDSEGHTLRAAASSSHRALRATAAAVRFQRRADQLASSAVVARA